MHFVAMLAFSMPGMEVSYDPGLTLVSLMVPIVVTGFAFHVVNLRTADRLRSSWAASSWAPAWSPCTTPACQRCAWAPTFSYLGLWVAVSVLIAVGASTVALWLAFRRTGFELKLVASVAMGLAISGMHYAAMQGAVFTAHAEVDGAQRDASIGQTTLALAVTAATFLILFLASIAAMFDRRFALLAERDRLRRLHA